jgi:hypothetical protein
MKKTTTTLLRSAAADVRDDRFIVKYYHVTACIAIDTSFAAGCRYVAGCAADVDDEINIWYRHSVNSWRKMHASTHIYPVKPNNSWL